LPAGKIFDQLSKAKKSPNEASLSHASASADLFVGVRNPFLIKRISSKMRKKGGKEDKKRNKKGNGKGNGSGNGMERKKKKERREKGKIEAESTMLIRNDSDSC